MRIRSIEGVLAGLAAVFICALAGVGGAGCGGGTASPSADAGSDSGTATGSDASVFVAVGTTGQECTTSDTCQVDGGVAHVCSNTLVEPVDGLMAQLWPTPVCLETPAAVGGNCDPAPPNDPDGLKVHYCDGSGPDDSSSPGVCVPFAPSNPVAGLGTCYPQCTFSTDGTPAKGCQGFDTCAFLGYTLVGAAAGNSLLGIGFCQGTCQKDTDCAALGATYHCQTDIGYCTTAPVVRTKAPGAACTAADSASGACNCFVGPSGNGYCSTRCVVGGLACPSGWVCDTGEPAIASIVAGSTSSPVVPTQGMVGTCAPACALPGDAGTDAAAEAGSTDASSTADGDATAGDATPGDAGAADASDAGSDATADSDGSVLDDGGDASSDAGADGGADDGAADAGSTSDASSLDASPNNVCPQNAACVGGGAVGADCLPQ
jgi:hypothetical protein